MNSSAVSLSLFAIITAILIRLLIKNILHLRRLPPGPWGLPLVGSMVNLLKHNTFGELEKYRQKYGNIFSIGIGNFNVVVLNGHKLILEAFKREEFLGRPDFETWELKNLGIKNRGILFCDGNSTWNEQRRFALRNLRDFGFGKESMEGLLLHELQELIGQLKKSVGKPAEMKNLFNASVLNSLWYILTGQRFELDDPVFAQIISLLTTNVKGALVCGPGFFLPWPAKHNLIAKGKWAAFGINRTLIANLIKAEVDKHIETYTHDDNRDFIDVYLSQWKRAEPNSSFYGEEGIMNLRVTLHDLFIAGTETTSTTLLWALLFLSKEPWIQEKLFAEVDSVIGKMRLPTRDDKPNMPYTEAVLNEVHRLASLVPLSIFHNTFEDTTLEGHFIPKNTVIFANIYGAHHSKEHWKDPENCRPERFLDPSGKTLLKNEGLIPFSTGKRVCLGETLARDTLFLFLTGIIQQFSFTLVTESTDYKFEDLPNNCSLILQPDPFQIILKNRT